MFDVQADPVLPAPPDLPPRRDRLIVAFVFFAGGAGEELGHPGVAAFAGMRLAGGTAERCLGVARVRLNALGAVTGAAEQLGPKLCEGAAALPAVGHRAPDWRYGIGGDGRLGLLPRAELEQHVRLDPADGLFQRHSCGQDVRLVQRQLDASHFAEKGAPGAVVQPPARVTGVRIERTYGLGYDRIIVSHPSDECRTFRTPWPASLDGNYRKIKAPRHRRGADGGS